MYSSTSKTSCQLPDNKLLIILLGILTAYSVVRFWIFHTLPHDHYFPMYDSIIYMDTSKLSLLNPYFYPFKPFLYSLIVKIMARNVGAILLTQNLISIIAWFVLANCIRKQIVNTYLGLAALISILVYSCAAYIVIWDVKIMTESFSISLLAIFLASYLTVFNLRFKSRLAWILIAVALMLAAIRDSNAYFVLLVAVTTLLAAYYLRKSPLSFDKKGLCLFLGGSLAAFCGSYITQFYRFPESLCTTLIERVKNYPGASDYFIEHGAPYITMNPFGCEGSSSTMHWLQKHEQKP